MIDIRSIIAYESAKNFLAKAYGDDDGLVARGYSLESDDMVYSLRKDIPTVYGVCKLWYLRSKTKPESALISMSYRALDLYLNLAVEKAIPKLLEIEKAVSASQDHVSLEKALRGLGMNGYHDPPQA